MKVQQTTQTQFAGKHYLNPNQMKGIKNLLTRMNAETVTNRTETWFSSTITKELSYKKNKIRFIDGRMIFDKVADNEQMQRETLFTLGKTELVINNKTGEIIDWEKPLLTGWNRIMKKIDNSLKTLNEQYDNSAVVKKKKISFEGFTKKGIEILEKLKGKQ